MEKKRVLALTMGEPRGIGPEISTSAASCGALREVCDLVLFGEREVLQSALELVGASHWRLTPWDFKCRREACPHELFFVETGNGSCQKYGRGDKLSSYRAIVAACKAAQNKEVDAIVTAPVNKVILREAGVSEIGHTEILASYFDVKDPLTVFQTEKMRIFFFSRHLSLREAVDAIEREAVFSFIKRSHEAMIQQFGKKPQLGLAALNPHAGDGGQFGLEEVEELIPAAQRARSLGICVSDPIGADSVFYQALEGRFDAVLSLYHDQGHIAAKTRDFHGTITATLGLPVLRTSVDHGTAEDIAWQGVADPRGMIEACKVALEWLKSPSE